MNVNTTTVKKWAYIFSPCIILAIFFAVIACIYATERGEHGEAGTYMVYAILLMVPALIISLLIDFGIKFWLKKKVLYIWMIEGVIVLLVLSLLF